MTLFIRNLDNTRQYEIHDAYIMALAFILGIYVQKISKAVILKLSEKEKKKNNKKTQIPNPRGGDKLTITLTDETNELAVTILSCIADNTTSVMKNEKLKQLLFDLVKVKITKESLVLTPNLIRLLATQLIKTSDQGFITRLGNYVFLSDNRSKLNIRLIGASALGIIGSALNLVPFFILLIIVYLSETGNTGYPCENYFDSLPQDNPVVKVLGDSPSGNLIIMENDPNRAIEIYSLKPKTTTEIISSENNKQTVTKTQKSTYKLSRKKAKQINFSDFRKTDPILSKYKNLDEPHVPQIKSFKDLLKDPETLDL